MHINATQLTRPILGYLHQLGFIPATIRKVSEKSTIQYDKWVGFFFGLNVGAFMSPLMQFR